MSCRSIRLLLYRMVPSQTLLRLPIAPSDGARSRSGPQESSKKEVLRVCSQMDELMEEAKEEAANGNQGPSRRR